MARYRTNIFGRSEKFFMETELGWEMFWNDTRYDEDPFENDDGNDAVAEMNVMKFDSSQSYKRPESPNWLIERTELKTYKDQSTQTVHLSHVSTCTQTDDSLQSDITLDPKKVRTELSNDSNNEINEEIKNETNEEINNETNEQINDKTNDKIEFQQEGLLKTILEICLKRSKSAEIPKPDITKFIFNIPSLQTDFSYYERQALLAPTKTFLYARDSEVFLVNEEEKDDDLRAFRLAAKRFAKCLGGNSSHEEADAIFMDAESNLSRIDLKGNTVIKDAGRHFVVTDLNFNKSCVVINDRIVIDKYSWNTMVAVGSEARRCCTVCSEETSGLETLRHLELERHKRSLLNAPPLEAFGENLIRRINENTHCAICNRIVPEALDHISHPLHILQYSWAVDPDSSDKRKVQWKNKSDIENDPEAGDQLKVTEDNMVAADEVTSSVKMLYETQHPKIQTDVKSAPKTRSVILERNEAVETSVQSHSALSSSSVEQTGSPQSQIAPKKFDGDPECMVVTVRGKKYIISTDAFHCLIPFKDSFYCMACNARFPLDKKNEHTSSENHCGNLLYEAFMDQFGENMIRKLDPKFYHCCMCNKLITYFTLNQHIYDNNHKLLTRTMMARSTPRNIQNQEHTDQNNTACVVNRNAGKVFLNMGGVQLRINRLSWHGIAIGGEGVHQCILCLKDISPKMIDRHLETSQHQTKTQQIFFLAEFGEHLIRPVDEGRIHCAICNKTISSDKEQLTCHIQGWSHMKQLNLAKETNLTNLDTSPLLEMPDRASERPIDMNKNGRPDHSMFMHGESILLSDVPNTSRSQSDLLNSSQVEQQSLTVTNEHEQCVMLPAPKLQKANTLKTNGAVKKKTQETAPQECIVVTFQEKIFIVSNNAWHCISSEQQADVSYCHICGVRMPTDLVREHKDSSQHLIAMSGRRILNEISGQLLRRLENQQLSCVTCNAIVLHKTIDGHISKKKHNNKLLKAQDISVGMDLIRRAKMEPIEHVKVLASGHLESMLLPLYITIEILEVQKSVEIDNIQSLPESGITGQDDSMLRNVRCGPTAKLQNDVNVTGHDAAVSSGQKHNVNTIKQQNVLVTFRAAKFVVSSDAWYAVNSQPGNMWCCYVCDTEFQTSALEEHKLSAQHELAMREALFLNYTGHLLRQLKLGIIHCLTCHSTVPPTQLNIEGHIAGRKHMQLLQTAKDTLDEIDSADLDSMKRATIFERKDDTEKNAQQSRSTVTAIPESSNSSSKKKNTISDTFKQPKHVLVTFGEDKFIVSNDAWYAVNSKSTYVWFCYLCSTNIHPSAVKEHYVSAQHALAMREAPFLCCTGHLLRQLKLDKLHCLTCHTIVIVTQLNQHIAGRIHQELLQMAKDILGEIDDADLTSIKRVKVSVAKVNTENNAPEHSSNAAGIPGSSSSNATYSSQKENQITDILKQPRHVLVTFYADKFIVSNDAWYAVKSEPSNVWCCFICNTKIEPSALEEHLVSAQHVLAMREAPYLDYSGHLLRQLKFGVVHCLTCHTTLPPTQSNIEGHISGRKHKQLLQKAKDTIDEIDGSDLNLLKHATILMPKVDTENKAQPSCCTTTGIPESSANSIISASQKENIITDILKQPRHVLVTFRADKFIITNHAWYAVNSQPGNVWCCFLCSTKMQPSALEEHLTSAQHVLAMREAPYLDYSGHLLRQLPLGITHCLTCHTIVPANKLNTEGHIAGKKHKQLLLKAKDVLGEMNGADFDSTMSLPKVDTENSAKKCSSTTTGILGTGNKEPSAKLSKKALKRITECSDQAQCAEKNPNIGGASKGIHAASNEGCAKISRKESNAYDGTPESSIEVPGTVKAHGSAKATVESSNRDTIARGKKKARFTATLDSDQPCCVTFCGKTITLPSNAWHGVQERCGGTLRCSLCRIDMDRAGLESHKKSVRHHIAMMDTQMLEDNTDHFIREVSSTLVNCLFCNTLLHRAELDDHISGSEHAFNRQYSVDYDLEPELEDTTERINVDLLITSKSTDFCVLYNPDVSLSAVVSAHAWHGLKELDKRFRCFLCAIAVDEFDLEVHKSSKEHFANLKTFLPSELYPGEFVRKLENLIHCVSCDVIVQPQDIERHIKKEKHVKNLLEARNNVLQIRTANIVNFSQHVSQEEHGKFSCIMRATTSAL